MIKIKNFLKALAEVVVETRKLKAESFARKYNKV